jgi:pimeloyl-ACP methyl ester carboxylesterase
VGYHARRPHGLVRILCAPGPPVYVPDQVGRARSGFDQQVFNDVRSGTAEKTSQPSILRLGDKYGAWTNFRFGPSPGVPFSNNQFPVEAAAELSKQGIPDLNQLYQGPNPTFKALSDLAIQLKGAVLMGHSQGARFPTEAALIDASGLKGLILVEPGNCTAPWGTPYSDEQIAKLAKLPILLVFGDNLSNPTGLAAPNWQVRFEDCERFISKVNAAKGKAEMLFPPKLGIFGNTHMIMQDRNSLAIADLIMKWVDNNVK